ncbi:MAG: (Cytosine-5)-methyltransferase 1 [Ferruginibacter sp.]|uniref:DNA cytosine methyltransferase n=1 Tax=Ferruginibacter sp. TaxID=1940288 RepID=UPI00265A5AC1|nr:DNA (cytosine-5-)-methyltransferase [Ferruginibacter sp.]MDB5279055.1 (Cytosine-5)-methyltransferase 1 [Ferruginibacter sp.]
MRKNEVSEDLRTIDLFCGAGGSSYGARNAGANIVAGFDLWSTAIKAYGANFPEARTFEGDLRNLDPVVVKKELGKIDLMLASPECTNHSLAKGAKLRDEASKETAFEVTRYAKAFSPKWIVIENVKEMQSWSGHSRLLKELWDLEYFVKEIELNSADFGVAQARKRLFLLCSLSGETTMNDKQEGAELNAASTIIDWSDKYKFTPLFQEGRALNTLARAENAIDELGAKEPFIMVYYGTGSGWQSIEDPLRTITTLDRFALVKPSKKGHIMRMLQPEELKLAMGFGNNYSLDIGVTRREKIKLMGNGVCPPVMTSIIKNLCISPKP